MLRFLTVAALALSLTACAPGEGSDDSDTASDWFPTGIWELTAPAELAGYILTVTPPLVEPDAVDRSQVVYDPSVDYHLPYWVTLFQPYSLPTDTGPAQCYRSSSPFSHNTISDGNGLYDPARSEPIFMNQYHGNMPDFISTTTPDGLEIKTTFSLEDHQGNWLTDHEVEGFQLTSWHGVPVADPEKLEKAAGLIEGDLCSVGGHIEGPMREKLKGALPNTRSVLDLPRKPLPVGRTYQINGGAILKILSETGDRFVAKIAGRYYQGAEPGYKPSTMGGTFYVKSGVQHYVFDSPMIAYYEHQPDPYISDDGLEFVWPSRVPKQLTVLTSFGQYLPRPLHFPDWWHSRNFPGDVIADGITTEPGLTSYPVESMYLE